MNNKPRISGYQLMMLGVGSALMFPYTSMPIVNTPPANQDVWIVLFFAGFYTVVINTPFLILFKKFSGQNPNEVCEMILGKVLGKVVAFCFAALLFFCFTTCMLVAAVFVSVYVFPTTPSWAFLLYTLVPVSYVAYKGPAALGRLSVLIVPFVILTIVVFFLMGLDLMDLMVLKPVLADSTFAELNWGGFINAARYMEILIFFTFAFFLDSKCNIHKTYARAVTLFFVCYALILFPTLLVLGIDLAKNAFNPYFIYTRQAHSYGFIEKVQAINTLAWFPGVLLKFALYNFMVSFLLSGVFRTKSHKGFVIPLSVVGFILCLMPFFNKAAILAELASDRVYPWIVLPGIFGLPLILVIVYFARRKKIDALLVQKRGLGMGSDPQAPPPAGGAA